MFVYGLEIKLQVIEQRYFLVSLLLVKIPHPPTYPIYMSSQRIILVMNAQLLHVASSHNHK